MVVLGIDSASNQSITVFLKVDHKTYSITEEVGRQKAQIILTLIDRLLRECALELSDITALAVHTGPGSFTGLRVGIAVANTLSYALGIPINGKKAGTLVEPHYT